MLNIISRTVATAAVVLAAAVPATATAQIFRDPSSPARSQSPAIVIRPVASTTSSNGFSWGDAAIGAGGMLLVLGIGGTARVTTREKRVGRTVAA